jgi:hypothetical protein
MGSLKNIGGNSKVNKSIENVARIDSKGSDINANGDVISNIKK